MIRRRWKKQLIGAGVDRVAIKLLNTTDPEKLKLVHDFDYREGIDELE